MSAERRQRIADIVRAAAQPITGTELSQLVGVSRQIIVQDMAILRAAGHEIMATPRGYTHSAPHADRGNRHRAVLAVQHERDQIEVELTTLVDLGVRVIDVIVDHPIYGELRGNLMLESRADVKAFLTRLVGTEPLSALTRGVHLHTVDSARPGAVDEARDELRRLGILLENAPNEVDTSH